MTKEDRALKVWISKMVSYFIFYFPIAIGNAIEKGDEYIEDVKKRHKVLFHEFLVAYMDGFTESFYERYADDLTDEELDYINTSVYGLLFNYMCRCMKRLDAQYEEVYRKR